MKQDMINYLEGMKKNLKKDPSQTHINNVVKLVLSQKWISQKNIFYKHLWLCEALGIWF